MNTDYFIAGNEYVHENLDLKYIPRANLSVNDNGGGGITLADSNQDLNQSFLVAKNFFANAAPKSIKFVLIGLSPYVVSDKEPSAVCAVDEKLLEDYVNLCLANGARPVIFALPVHPALKKTYKADALKLFRDTINKVGKKFKANFIDLLNVGLSDKLFKDKTHLNSDGAAAISSLLGAKLYFAKVTSAGNILGMDGDFFNVLAKYFPNDYKTLIQHVFCRIACEDFKRLSETLPKDDCLNLMAHVFSEMTYNHLANLSDMLPKDDYNDLADRIFEISAEKIRRKDKIKVGFAVRGAAEWCGDDLYNFFVQNERFEPTVFLLPQSNLGNEIVQKDFWSGVERFKQRGFNVVALDKKNADVPAQDVLIFLTPYEFALAFAFLPAKLNVKTLTVYIPYGINTTKFNAATRSIVWTAWKAFLSSTLALNLYKTKIKVGMPHGFYSGYPRMDVFFKKDTAFQFDWKMARPDAKKIIWAPHWSIAGGIKYATFQWNYQFMYEFAKAHPEISWLVKPHPLLLSSAVNTKIFLSVKAFEEYLQEWNDLPNAQVYTGAYYQDIFATSDGMIHDCGSFTAEYQYVDKPMIYLTREGANHNELGDKILEASYTVDGKDLDAIAATIQRVIIEGDDYKADERKVVFDKYLNYPKANGMLASEFIYKKIVDDLTT